MSFLMTLIRGVDVTLPKIEDVEDPKHGQKGLNSRGQKVIYDEDQGKWVMPQNFSGREPVTITANGLVYTEFGIFLEEDTGRKYPLTMEQVVELREKAKEQE